MAAGVPGSRMDGLASQAVRDAPAAIAIGNFDGVHRGHQALARWTASWAREHRLEPLVLTFDPHPHEVLVGPGRSVLTTLDRKIGLLRRAAPQAVVIVEHFTRELAASSPEQFAAAVLVQALRARAVVVGEDFRFGYQRAGDLASLRELGNKLGFTLISPELVTDEMGPISSSRIRRLIEQGELKAAEQMLARPHALSGRVVHGDARGRTLGVPTANLTRVQELLPPHGVYACLVDQLDSLGEPHILGGGVLNVGVRPTMEAGFSLEVHVADFAGDLYGGWLRVHLIDRIREERRFPSVEELSQQIQRDILDARRLCRERQPDPAARGGWY